MLSSHELKKPRVCDGSTRMPTSMWSLTMPESAGRLPLYQGSYACLLLAPIYGWASTLQDCSHFASTSLSAIVGDASRTTIRLTIGVPLHYAPGHSSSDVFGVHYNSLWLLLLWRVHVALGRRQRLKETEYGNCEPVQLSKICLNGTDGMIFRLCHYIKTS